MEGGWGKGGDVLCPGNSSVTPSNQLGVLAKVLHPDGTNPGQSWFCPLEFEIDPIGLAFTKRRMCFIAFGFSMIVSALRREEKQPRF